MERYLWPVKIAAKIILSRLPVSYNVWRKIGLFRHGNMNQIENALKKFRLSLKMAYGDGGTPAGLTILEMGPGDSIASAVIGAAYGAEKIYLVDVGNYATRDMDFYRALAAFLRDEGLSAPDLTNAANFEDILKACRCEYLTGGLESLRAIPAASVDFIFSLSVFEHIRLRDFHATMDALARIITPGGCMSHNIDLKDHLAQSLNNLRFDPALWESDFFANSGFYTNRLRSSEIMASLEKAGFACTFFQAGRWPVLPVARAKMAAHFRTLSEDDLYIRTMHIILKPAQSLSKAA